MNSAVFILVLLATVVTMMTSLTITPTTYTVSVRLGEPIHLSCHISGIEPTDLLSDVRWYSYPNMVVYGNIDVSGGCGAESFACPETDTTDKRGIIRYDRGVNNDGTLTMTIASSTVIDNTTFSCGVVRKVSGSFKTSDIISVIVYVPVVTSPIPDHQTTRGTTTTASSPNASDTITTERIITSRQITTLFNHDTTPTKTSTTGDTGTATTNTFSQTVISALSTTVIEPKTSGPDPSSMTTVVDSTPGATGPSTTTVIAAVAVSAFVVIILLLVIIACLVSSRKRRHNNTEPTTMRLVSAASSPARAMQTDDQEGGNVYNDQQGHGSNTREPSYYENNIVGLPGRRHNEEGHTGPPPPPPIYDLPVNCRQSQRDNDSASPGYEHTHMRQTDRQQSEERQTGQQLPPIYALPAGHCRLPEDDRPEDDALRMSPERRVQEEAVASANEASSSKAGYMPLEIPTPAPPEYATLDPLRPRPTSGGGNLYDAVSMLAGGPNQTDDALFNYGSHDGQQGDGIPDHAPPAYAVLEPDTHNVEADDEPPGGSDEACGDLHSDVDSDIQEEVLSSSADQVEFAEVKAARLTP